MEFIVFNSTVRVVQYNYNLFFGVLFADFDVVSR